jgi:hypothetical protein
MKAASFVLGFFVAAILGAAVWWAIGSEAKPRPPKESLLAKGTEVQLLLLQPLKAGRSVVGTPVSMIVSEDVLDEAGNILIEAGSIAKAKVAASEAGSIASALTMGAGKLEIDLLDVRTTDGKSALLCSDAEDSLAPFSLDRTNAIRKDLGDAVSAVWNHEQTQIGLAGLRKRFMGEETKEALPNPDIKAVLAAAAKELNMNRTVELLEDESAVKAAWSNVREAAAQVATGDLSGLTNPELIESLKAVGELAKVVDAADNSMKSTVRGREVSAPAGTAVTAQVEEDVQVALKAE